MKTITKKLVFILFTTVAASAYAEPDTSLLKNSINPTAEIKSVKPSILPNIYEVQINNEIFYLTEDGEKVITGEIYDLKAGKNYTAETKNKLRQQALATIKDEDKIIFKAKDEKYKVTVFTDITCPYCSKLHNHIAEFNKDGITIEYLAYPRAGIGSDVQKNMQKIWCAADKPAAMNRAKLDHKIEDNQCDGGQVVEQFLLGRDIGVNATPTLVFSDGEIAPGYVDPATLLSILQQKFPNAQSSTKMTTADKSETTSATSTTTTNEDGSKKAD